MSNLLATALGRSGQKAGRAKNHVKGQTDDDRDDVTGEDETPDTDAEDHDDEPEAADETPDEDAAAEDDDYTSADEETEEGMAASRRGASRVMAIFSSDAGMANPAGALTVARIEKLTASEAIGLIPQSNASKPKGKLDARLRGKAKALAPDGAKPKATGLPDRILAASKQAITNKRKR